MHRKLISAIIFTAIISSLLTYFIDASFWEKNESEIVAKDPIIKGNILSNTYMEGTPFIWQNSLYYLISARNDDEKKYTLVIIDHENRQEISPHFGDGLSLASAFVDGNTLYIFGTKNWTIFGKSEIVEITTKDLQHFTEPRTVYTADADTKIFNTSVTYNDQNKSYVMAIETHDSRSIPFTIRFLRSWDLISWQSDEYSLFGKDTYVACPTIRYVDNYYYLLYGDEYFYDPNCIECKKYITQVARSSDLIHWDTSSIPVLLPDPDGTEGTSTADLDLAEYKGKTYMTYSISDQATWGDLKTATFDGSMKSFFSIFFE